MRKASDVPAEVLELEYARAVGERDRIRSARAFFARQLGPLPAFAGISVALVGAFSEKVDKEGWVWVALAAFVAMTVVSMLYSRMPAYRQLRAHADPVPAPQDTEAWYRAELDREWMLYGEPRAGNELLPPRRKLTDDLQTALDRERTGVFVAQLLFLIVIASLVLARLA
jgi:hypothetical protein